MNDFAQAAKLYAILVAFKQDRNDDVHKLPKDSGEVFNFR